MDPYIGELRLFAGTFAPVGWLSCNGQLLNISDYTALYQLIGTTYGGDGQSTFGLPDLRARVAIGMGAGSGLTPRSLGQASGSETHTLINTEMPSHSHPATANDAAATTLTPGTSVAYGTVTPNGNTYSLYTALNQPDVSPAKMGANAVGFTGGGQPHDNTMPTTPINYIIATSGIYPTQN